MTSFLPRSEERLCTDAHAIGQAQEAYEPDEHAQTQEDRQPWKWVADTHSRPHTPRGPSPVLLELSDSGAESQLGHRRVEAQRRAGAEVPNGHGGALAATSSSLPNVAGEPAVGKRGRPGRLRSSHLQAQVRSSPGDTWCQEKRQRCAAPVIASASAPHLPLHPEHPSLSRDDSRRAQAMARSPHADAILPAPMPVSASPKTPRDTHAPCSRVVAPANVFGPIDAVPPRDFDQLLSPRSPLSTDCPGQGALATAAAAAAAPTHLPHNTSARVGSTQTLKGAPGTTGSPSLDQNPAFAPLDQKDMDQPSLGGPASTLPASLWAASHAYRDLYEKHHRLAVDHTKLYLQFNHFRSEVQRLNLAEKRSLGVMNGLSALFARFVEELGRADADSDASSTLEQDLSGFDTVEYDEIGVVVDSPQRL